MKLGRNPSTKEVKFKFGQFADRRKLPQPPKEFGNETFLPRDGWHTFGNENFGDCVLAGAAHETLLWCHVGQSQQARFDDKSVLAAYSAITGFNPSDPSTDQGTDMAAAASYRRNTGMTDADGRVHKVKAYLEIDADDLVAHYQALWLFEAVGIGFRFPASAWSQFKAGKPWSYVRGSSIDGGHYVPLVAKRRSLQCVTWGKLQPMSTTFLQKLNEESLVYISEEALLNQKSQEGFDYAGLLDALNSLPRAAG
jgi:hypothetical protein